MHRRFGPSKATALSAVRVAAAYGLLATVATALVLSFREGAPWSHPTPWLALSPVGSVTTSALFGVTFALGLITLTRFSVTRYTWARRLHLELRPVARSMTLGHILLIAGLSSLGEELLFRSLLAPAIGVAASSVLFGLAHQMRGASRWIWAGWATAVGAGLGAIFAATGSLVGPLLAHALVNAVNLTYLRDHDPQQNPERTPA